VTIAAGLPPSGELERPAGTRASRSRPTIRFAVVDLETTGLDPRSDRVVECAVVELDGAGDIVAEWSTLVSVPGACELGAEAIHGISRAMLTGAPRFSDVAADLVDRLAGRVVVGHVLAFDLGHLRSEFARTGICLPVLSPSGLCTRELARAYLPPGPRTLKACCEAAEVDCDALHTALGDARATAALLGHFLSGGYPIDCESRSRHGRTIVWPNLLRRDAPLVARVPPRRPKAVPSADRLR